MADYEWFAGDTKIVQVTVVDGAGAVVNLTGAQSIRWQLSRNANIRPPLLAKAVGSGITVISAAAGRFDVAIASADTEALSGRYYHEAEMIDAAGNVATVLSGTIKIDAALIKPA